MRLGRLLLLIAICVVPASGQVKDDPSASDSELTRHAQVIFTELLDSKQKADSHIGAMLILSGQTPYRFSTFLNLSRELLIQRCPVEAQEKVFSASANMAAKLTSDDEGFVKIALAIGNLRSDKTREAYGWLSALDSMGVPVWDLIGEAIGKKPFETKRIAQEGRARPQASANLLCEKIEEKYAGAAKRLLENLLKLQKQQ